MLGGRYGVFDIRYDMRREFVFYDVSPLVLCRASRTLDAGPNRFRELVAHLPGRVPHRYVLATAGENLDGPPATSDPWGFPHKTDGQLVFAHDVSPSVDLALPRRHASPPHH